MYVISSYSCIFEGVTWVYCRTLGGWAKKLLMTAQCYNTNYTILFLPDPTRSPSLIQCASNEYQMVLLDIEPKSLPTQLAQLSKVYHHVEIDLVNFLGLTMLSWNFGIHHLHIIGSSLPQFPFPWIVLLPLPLTRLPYLVFVKRISWKEKEKKIKERKVKGRSLPYMPNLYKFRRNGV